MRDLSLGHASADEIVRAIAKRAKELQSTEIRTNQTQKVSSKEAGEASMKS
jgi:hypothetical protein